MNRINRSPIGSLTKQQGVTFWSAVFVSTVVLIFAYIGMRLVPVYLSNASVKNAMEIALQDVNLKQVRSRQVIDKINQQLYLDGNQGLLNYKTDVKMSRTNNEFVLQTHYRSEISLFYNLSIVAEFDNEVRRKL